MPVAQGVGCFFSALLSSLESQDSIALMWPQETLEERTSVFLATFFVNLTLARVILEGRTSVEKWPMAYGIFSWVVVDVGRCSSLWMVVLGAMRK